MGSNPVTHTHKAITSFDVIAFLLSVFIPRKSHGNWNLLKQSKIVLTFRHPHENANTKKCTIIILKICLLIRQYGEKIFRFPLVLVKVTMIR